MATQTAEGAAEVAQLLDEIDALKKENADLEALLASPPPQAKVRWGVMATGKIAHDFCIALEMLAGEGAEIAAVGSRSAESAAAFGARFNIPRCHGSYEALAADEGVDVVYVATPHQAHHACVMLALEQGKHVLCEKPLALNVAQSRELLDAARARAAPRARRVVALPAVLRGSR